MAAADLEQFLARALQAAFVEIDRGHARAGLRKIDRDGAADAAAPAGHHADAAGQAEPIGRELGCHDCLMVQSGYREQRTPISAFQTAALFARSRVPDALRRSCAAAQSRDP